MPNRGDLSGADLRGNVPVTGTSAPSGTGDPSVRPPTDQERHQQKIQGMEKGAAGTPITSVAPGTQVDAAGTLSGGRTEDRQTPLGDAAVQGKPS